MIAPLSRPPIVASWFKSLAPKMVKRQYGVLTAILNYAVATDLIARAPARGVRIPTARALRTYRPAWAIPTRA